MKNKDTRASGRKHFFLAPGEDISGSTTESLLRNKKEGSGRHGKSDPIFKVVRVQFQRSAEMCECSSLKSLGPFKKFVTGEGRERSQFGDIYCLESSDLFSFRDFSVTRKGGRDPSLVTSIV